MRTYGNSRLRHSALIAALLISLPSMAHAQPRSNPNADSYVLRTYEVSDLVVSIQDHPFSDSLERASTGSGGRGGMGGGGGGGGGMFSVPDVRTDPQSSNGFGAARPAVARIQLCQFGGGGSVPIGPRSPAPAAASIAMEDLVRVLVSTVDANSWAENGGREGVVQILGTALVVWQTPAVHEQIEELLKQLRMGIGDRKTMTIDARWLFIDSDELDRLVAPDQTGIPIVDRKTLAEFTRRPGSLRAITNCFSSQLVYLVSGVRRNVVSGYIPVVGQAEQQEYVDRLASARPKSLVRFVSDADFSDGGRDSKVGYQPIVEKPNLGVLLEIRPTWMRTDDTVVVDLKSTLTVPGPQAASTSGGAPPTVDRIAIDTNEFATTLRMPLGKPILVGGLTNLQKSVLPVDQDKPANETSQLYFVLEVR
jgi:hypothetical protein